MQEYQCGIRSEDLIPFGSSPMDFSLIGLEHDVTESARDNSAGLVILIIMLAIPLLCIFAFCWIVDRVSNFMDKLRHERRSNEDK